MPARRWSLVLALALVLSGTTVNAQQTSLDSARSSLATDSARRSEMPEVGFTQHGVWMVGGAHLGRPTGVSAEIGAALGLGRVYPGSLFAEVEPGITGMRYGAGYLVHENVTWIGASLSAVHLHAWRTALGARRGVRYNGVQGSLMLLMMNLRVAGLAGMENGQRVNLTTVDLGMGF